MTESKPSERASRIDSHLRLLEQLRQHFLAIKIPLTQATVYFDGVETLIPIPEGAIPVPFDPNNIRTQAERADELLAMCDDYVGGSGAFSHALRSEGTPSADKRTPLNAFQSASLRGVTRVTSVGQIGISFNTPDDKIVRLKLSAADAQRMVESVAGFLLQVGIGITLQLPKSSGIPSVDGSTSSGQSQ